MPTERANDALLATAEGAVRRLVERPIGGYHPTGDDATEPTAWAALALATAGEDAAAKQAADWLAERQNDDGSVGVTAAEPEPGWPTSLAMLAWDAVDPSAHKDRIRHGARWALAQEPWTAPRHPHTGHDTTLEGWSWAPATHSWLEPTAFFSVALRRAGFVTHDRRQQAIAMMVDRLLSGGGANYGNTTVLGQELLQHLQPSGVVAWALSEESVTDPRLPRTLAYLNEAALKPTGVASLAWAARGLAAYGVLTDPIADRLAEAWRRAEPTASVYRTALVALAAQEANRDAAPRTEVRGS